jgi:hypothetical protein
MGPAGVPEHHYGMAQVSNNAWSQLSGAVADTASNLVTADVQNFGMVAVRRGNPSEPCTAPEFRQFDFWLGLWTVNTVQSDITTEPSGCAIFEWYKAPVHGHSISVYDPRTNKWYQTYHPGVAPHYSMSGGLVNDRMVLFIYNASGARVQRWTWEANADGTVTQSAASTVDDGVNWQPGFAGVYRKR